MMIRSWIWAAIIMAAAVVYEFVALRSDDLWEWSEILSRISDNKFAYGAMMFFIGYTLGHVVPHVSRFAGWLQNSG